MYSIALVIGTPSAQEIRLKVLDDCILNSGVYAMGIHLLSEMGGGYNNWIKGQSCSDCMDPLTHTLAL